MSKQEPESKQHHEELIGKPATFDHLAKKKPVERTVSIYLEDGPVDHFNEVAQEYERLRLRRNTGKADDDAGQAELARLKKKVDAARAALEEVTVYVRFRSIGRRNFEDLMREHPPTEEQKAEAKEKFGQETQYNGDTFPPALIAASAIEPELTVEQAEQIVNDWNESEAISLFQAAYEVNTQRRVADLGKASG